MMTKPKTFFCASTQQSSSFFLVMDSLTFKTTRKWILDFLVPNTWARVGMIPDSFFHPYVSFQFFQYTTNRNGILYRINVWFEYIRINSVQFNKTKEYRTEAFLSNIFHFLKKKKNSNFSFCNFSINPFLSYTYWEARLPL